MPSNQLSLLSQQIEKQDTDHFGKFYMYVSLLNTLTVRNKTFTDGLPKHIGFFGKDNLNIGGELPVEFTNKLNIYARGFINSQPHWSKSLHNIVMVYFRKGKITDLTFIIDQMLNQLTAIHGVQSHNNKIYNSIKFEEKKEGLAQFIEQVAACNQQLISTIDSGCNTALSILAATTGLVLVIASIFSIVPLIIGLPLLIGGAIGAYYFVTKGMEQTKQIKTEAEKLGEKLEKLPQDKSLFGDINHLPFYAAVVKPLPYAALTAAEQLVFNKTHLQKVNAERETLDEKFKQLSL